MADEHAQQIAQIFRYGWDPSRRPSTAPKNPIFSWGNASSTAANRQRAGHCFQYLAPNLRVPSLAVQELKKPVLGV
jgi:hypothetical protein